MFILRKITGNGGELNFALGDSYSLILKESNPKEFKEVLSVEGHDAFEDDLYGFITYGDCQHQMLFKNHFNYIMTDTGKTFTNVTHHGKMRARNAELTESEKHFESVQKLHKEVDGKPYPPDILIWDGDSDKANKVFGERYGKDWAYLAGNKEGDIVVNGTVIKIGDEISKGPGFWSDKVETKLSDHFTKSICHALKHKLNIETVEEAALYSDEELLKVNGFGRIALRNLRKIRTDLAFKKLGVQ